MQKTRIALRRAVVVSCLVLVAVGCSASATGSIPLAATPFPSSFLAGSAGGGAGPIADITLPPQGLYDSCLPSESDCLAHLAAMGAAGFRVVLNDGLRYVSRADELRTYAARAAELGIGVILPISYSPEWDTDDAYLVKQFPELAAEGGCADNVAFLSYYLGVLKGHPALWGYYMADEVHSEFHDGLKIYSALVKELDPSHPRLIVEEGTNDPTEIFFRFHSYMRDTTDVLASDNYPYGYIDTYGSPSRYTGESARVLREWSSRLGLKHAIVLQAFAWPQDHDVDPLCSPWPACAPFPSYEQMKAQRDQALQNSAPEVILWFYYPYILSSERPAQHWADLVAAAFAPLPTLAPSPTPRPQICPPHWTCEDVGSPKLEGMQVFDGDTWTVEGSGSDTGSSFWDRADKFRYVWQSMQGDGELSVRVVDQTNMELGAEAGVMVRKTFDPVSPFYAVWMRSGRGVDVQSRTGYNQEAIDVTSQAEALPLHLKVSRSGTSYSAWRSPDGVEWSLIPDSTQSVAGLTGTLMVGLAVTSGSHGVVSRAQFDHVTLAVPSRVWLPTLTLQVLRSKESEAHEE